MALLHDIDLYTPSTLDEALLTLSKREGALRVIAGGTDVIVQMKDGVLPKHNLLNIFGLKELRYVTRANGQLRIGALTSFAELAAHPLVQRYASMLAEAAAAVGSFQIMNKASIGGNLVNASPAADSVPTLYALDATLVLRSGQGRRELPISQFYRGYKRVNLRADELVTEVRIPEMSEGDDGVFFKHGLRLGNACAVVNGAIWVRRAREHYTFRDARVVLGAVAPTAVRAHKAEALLVGRRQDDASIQHAAHAVVDAISPVDDVRGSAAYRREVSVGSVYIGLWELLHRTT